MIPFITGFKLTMYLVKYVLRGDFQNNLIYASSLCSQESLYKQIFAPLPAVQKSGKRIISLQRSDITGDGTFLPATSIFEQSRFSPKAATLLLWRSKLRHRLSFDIWSAVAYLVHAFVGGSRQPSPVLVRKTWDVLMERSRVFPRNVGIGSHIAENITKKSTP